MTGIFNLSLNKICCLLPPLDFVNFFLIWITIYKPRPVQVVFGSAFGSEGIFLTMPPDDAIPFHQTLVELTFRLFRLVSGFVKLGTNFPEPVPILHHQPASFSNLTLSTSMNF